MNRCTLDRSQNLCSSEDSLKTSAARSPEFVLSNCRENSTLPHNFCHFCVGFWLDCSSFCWCLTTHFLPNKLCKYCDRECCFDGLRAESFFSNFFSNLFTRRFRGIGGHPGPFARYLPAFAYPSLNAATRDFLTL